MRGGGSSRERFFVAVAGERDWMGGSALLRAVSLSEELLNACANEGRDWGMDMASTRKKEKKKETEPKIAVSQLSVASGISQVQMALS